MDTTLARASRVRAGWLPGWRGAWLLAVGAMLVCCGEQKDGPERPGITIHAVSPLAFTFHNGTGADLYLDWAAPESSLHVLRDEAELLIDPGCAQGCEQPCVCGPCPQPPAKVVRVESGEDITLEWDATHFVKRSCDAGAGCKCVQPWPATAGSYRARVVGWRAVLGGVPSATDPRVLEGAVVDQSSGSCEATATFELVGGAHLTVPFACP
jgi:hypothetical protein